MSDAPPLETKTPEGHDPNLYASAQQFVDSVKELYTPTTLRNIASKIRSLARFAQKECSVRDWAEFTAKHYEDYLRTFAARASSPNSQFAQSTAKRFFDHLATRGALRENPTTGISVGAGGVLIVEGRNPEFPPQAEDGSRRHAVELLESLPEGFRGDALSHLEALHIEGRTGIARKTARTLVDFCRHVQSLEATNTSWRQVDQGMISDYGQILFRTCGSKNTAAMKLSVLRMFFDRLVITNRIPSNPFEGIKVIDGEEVQVAEMPGILPGIFAKVEEDRATARGDSDGNDKRRGKPGS